MEALDTSIGTIEDVEAYLEVPVLGIIPHVDRTEVKEAILTEHHFSDRDHVLSGDTQLPTHFLPRSAWAESYRALRTNIQFLNVDQEPQTILISSALAEEGKTTTIVNLGIAMAQMGKSVLLVDADLRRPKIARTFGLSSEPGLTEIILGHVDWREAVRMITDIMTGEMGMEEAMSYPGLEQLNIITSGTIPPNPSELLSHPRLPKLVSEFKEEYDTILFDSAPIIPATDAAVLGTQLDGMMLVYQVGKVARGSLKRAKVQMENVKTRVFGVVLNELRLDISPDFQGMRHKDKYYKYGYSYGHSYGDGRRKYQRWIGYIMGPVRKYLGWPGRRTPRLAEEGKLLEDPKEKGALDRTSGHKPVKKSVAPSDVLEPEVAGEKRSSRWRIGAMALSVMLLAVGILWQAGYLAPLLNGFAKPKILAIASESQTASQQPPEIAELQAALVESGGDSTGIPQVIDRSIEAIITASKQPTAATPEALGEVVAEGSTQEGEPTQTPEGYYIKWGVYRDRVNAQNMLALLSEEGAEAFIEQGEGLDRVLLGPFSKYADAKAEAEQLGQKVGRSYWIFGVSSNQ